MSVLCIPGASWAAWSVQRLYDAQGVFERCVVASPLMSMSDGYQDTQVAILVSTHTILVKAKAPLDDAFQDIGLQVGKHDFIKMDKVIEARLALFATHYATILAQMTQDAGRVKKGRKPVLPTLKLQLRFWPTWPTKGTQTLDVSLEGFREAYAALGTCQ